MSNIVHRIGIENAGVTEVYQALSTIDGLARWWTEDTSGVSEVGGRIAFRFIPGGFDMAVKELVPGKSVLWEVVEGPEEWVGTEISFALREDANFTIVLFEHRGWRDPVEFMYHCSTKWAMFLMSLKQLLETGVGAPAPGDVQISDWH